MTELLVVKSGEEYLRFQDDDFAFCTMSKASVYPLSRLAEVCSRMHQVTRAGIECKLMKLTITETAFAQTSED